MNTDTQAWSYVHLPPDFKAVVVSRHGRNASASSHATDYFYPNPDQWEGKVSALLQSLRCALTKTIQNQEYRTRTAATRTSLRAP